MRDKTAQGECNAPQVRGLELERNTPVPPHLRQALFHRLRCPSLVCVPTQYLVASGGRQALPLLILVLTSARGYSSTFQENEGEFIFLCVC